MQTQLEKPDCSAMEECTSNRRRWVGPVLLLGLTLLLAALLLAGVLPRMTHAKQLEQAAAPTAQLVSVMVAVPGDPVAAVELPSSVEALQESPLYPRVNGYVKQLYVDIGSQVRAGDVLAEIETPELDQQVNAATAALEQAKANYTLAAISFGRWQELQRSRVVAAQEVDERKGALDARLADRNAAQANLERLTRMQGFQKITAPFAGTVTRRMIEVGQLVTGDLNDATRMLFQLQNLTSLRAFVNVPQSDYRLVSVGQTVALSFREVPGRTFPGTVVRTAGALDGATRTLRTEIHVSNEAGELLPGLYAEVKFQVQREHPPIVVPARALIIQSAGPQIATVDASSHVSLRPVTIGRDFGSKVEIASGVALGERLVINPGDTLRDGMTVRVDGPEPARLAAR
jgi:RND family efflux transporter MFP subunit